MRKYLLPTLCVLVLFSASGCATWKQFKAEEYKDKKRHFIAQVPTDWMRFNLGNFFLMTKDGISLEYVRLDRMKLNKDLEFTKKKYMAGMQASELAEISVDNYQSNKDIAFFTVTKNVPLTLDGQDAYHLEYSYVSSSGLKKKGIEYGFIESERVFRISYEAAAQHYFDANLKTFEDFISSFQLIKEN